MFRVAQRAVCCDDGGMTRSRKILLAVVVSVAFLGVHFGMLGPGQRAPSWGRFGIHFFCAASVAQLLRSGLHGMELTHWIRPLGPRIGATIEVDRGLDPAWASSLGRDRERILADRLAAALKAAV